MDTIGTASGLWVWGEGSEAEGTGTDVRSGGMFFIMTANLWEGDKHLL